MKRNVTIVLTDDTARWLRVAAAQREMSVSQFVGELVERERARAEGYDQARTRFLARKPRRLGPPGGRLPTRAEVHER
jgi:hypothetical protein